MQLDTKIDQVRVETATQKTGMVQFDQSLTGKIAINDQGKWNLNGKLQKEIHSISLKHLEGMSTHSNHAVTSRIAIVVSGIVTFLILALLIAIIVWRVLASKRRQRASQNDATRELKRINKNMRPLFDDDA